MKTSIRFISMFFAILMIAGLALTASADNSEANANSEALQLVVDLGIIEGYEDGSLKPEQLVERDEMAKIIFVLYTTMKDAGAASATFKDVPVDDWSAGYISWCANKGIIGGYGDGNFGPNDNVTYDQALKMVAGALGYTDWDPKFWPIDVRTLALTQLGLGENISGVNGSDKLTRAQVAQLVRNALFADMKETVEQPFVSSTGTLTTYITVAKKLASSVWKFKEVFLTIDAAGNTGESLITSDKDVHIDGINTDFTLEELGLEEYEGKLNDLMYSRVGVIYDSKKVSNVADIKAKNILAVSVIETVETASMVGYNDSKDVFVINNQEADTSNTELLVLNSNDEIVKTGLSGSAKKALVNLLDDKYYAKFWIYDTDEDDDYEYIRYAPLNAYKVDSVGTKKITLSSYPDASTSLSVDKEDLVSSKELKKDDVIIMYKDFANYVVEKVVEPISGAAVKWNKENITLADGTTYEHSEKIFKDTKAYIVSNTVTNINDKKETTSYDYYIYDGKIFGGNVTPETELKFAVLSYITKSKKEVLDETTMTKAYVYEALITVDGKEQTVKLNTDKLMNGKTAAALEASGEFDSYIAKYTNNGTDFVTDPADAKAKYLVKHHILVNYTIDSDGQYSLYTTDDSTVSDGDYVNFGVSTVKYNKTANIYSITGSNLSDTMALFADDVVFYYTYTSANTGYYEYLSSYKADNMPADMSEFVTTGDLYATLDKDTGIYMINVAVIDKDSIKYGAAGSKDYKTDAREILIATESSLVTLGSDGTSTYPTYAFISLDGKTVYPKTNYTDKSINNGATEAIKSHIYAWDETEDKYVEITNTTNNVTSVGGYKVDSIVNDILFTKEGKFTSGIKLTEDVLVWRIKKNTAMTPEYLTLDAFKEAFELCVEDENNTVEMRLIIGTYIDSNGEEVVHTIFVEGWDLDATGKPSSTGYPKEVFSAFGM